MSPTSTFKLESSVLPNIRCQVAASHEVGDSEKASLPTGDRPSDVAALLGGATGLIVSAWRKGIDRSFSSCTCFLRGTGVSANSITASWCCPQPTYWQTTNSMPGSSRKKQFMYVVTLPVARLIDTAPPAKSLKSTTRQFMSHEAYHELS